jgi:alanyl-tRNA synthetase
VPGWDAAALKTLALAIVSEPGLIAVLVGDGRPAPVVIARSADVAVDAGAWLRRATTELGGRGGGRPELAQGGIDANGNEILAFARHTLG